ncbi:MAG: hypothetical protein AB1705_26870 [Verrucomicrobiota bacterium]
MPKVESRDAQLLVSPAACRAEFRYLRRVYRQIDLSGPAVQTDGWTANIAEAEWPFLGLCYFGYACANLAAYDREFREEALAEMRWLLEALQKPRLTGFIAPHTGEPFGSGEIQASAFVHGHFLNLAARYREVSDDTRYDALMQRVAKGLGEGYARADQGILRSYKDMWWLSDNFVALSALARYDRLFKTCWSEEGIRCVKSVRAHYLDGGTGMYYTYITPENLQRRQGPRGISMMYGLHFLKDFAPEFAEQQYALARKQLVQSLLGYAAVREHPPGAEGREDIDSGPIVLGFGASASGFAIGAAAVMEDRRTAMELLQSLSQVGMPVMEGEELRYGAMPPVGQAVILFGKTGLLAGRP